MWTKRCTEAPSLGKAETRACLELLASRRGGFRAEAAGALWSEQAWATHHITDARGFSSSGESCRPRVLCLQLKEKSQACGGNLGSIEELRRAIYLAEEACPGISDTMVAQLVQRLQRYSLSGGGTSSH